jgi:multicomponent Na+:H+ antiporter subunit F
VSAVITGVLSVAGALFAARLLIGPTLPDRVTALNGLLLVGMALLALHERESGRGTYLGVLVVLALVSFVGTAMIARFLEGGRR